MTVVLHDEVVTPTRLTTPFGIGSDPLVDGAARVLSIGVRHVYAALWRVGLLEVT